MTRWLGSIMGPSSCMIPTPTTATTRESYSGIYNLKELNNFYRSSGDIWWGPSVAASSNNAEASTVDGNSFTTTLGINTTENGANKYVVVAAAGGGATASTFVTGITLNSTAMTLIHSTAAVSGTTAMSLSIWGMRTQTTGATVPVTATWGSTQGQKILWAARWSCITSTVPEVLASTITASSGTTTASLTVNIPAGVSVISWVANRINGTGGFTAGCTGVGLRLAGVEAQQIFSGITEKSSVGRSGHVITCTFSSGGQPAIMTCVGFR